MSETVALSILQLDLPEPSTGWRVYLAERRIPVRRDDLGRECVTREAARRLFVEQREAEARQREMREIAEREAVEADERRRAQIWGGVPADRMPAGEHPARAMLLAGLEADRDGRPRRRSVLEDSLNGGGLTFHPIEHEPDGGES